MTKIKNCSGDWKSCYYAGIGNYIACKYEGYCIYQLPNDGIRTYGDLNPSPKVPQKENDQLF